MGNVGEEDDKRDVGQARLKNVWYEMLEIIMLGSVAEVPFSKHRFKSLDFHAPHLF